MTLSSEDMARRPLDAKEAAEFLRVSHNTMLGLLRRGIVPGVKIGKSWRIPREALDAFLAGAAPSGQQNGRQAEKS